MKFNEIESIKERNEIVLLFSNWLRPYTHEVIVKVLDRTDEIINNEFAMKLLKELKEREEELILFNDSIDSLMIDFETFKQYDPHTYSLTHSKSYRDILYDMYIKE